MTPPNRSRRSVLSGIGTAAIGAVCAAGSVSLAGCTDRSDRSVWDDPPTFDPTGLESVRESSPPARPAIVPVPFDPTVAERFRGRVRALLAPIPEPLSAETLPNGAIRSRIREERAAARSALAAHEKLRDRRASPPALSVADRLVTARGHAANAVGTWAAVAERGAPRDVTRSVDATLETIESFGGALPGPARTVQEGTAVYGAIERWLDVARRSTLVGGVDAIEERANPLRTGSAVGDVETVQARIDAGRHLRRRYVALPAVADGVPAATVESAIVDALEALAPRIEERLLDLHGADASEELEHPIRYPDSDVYREESSLPRDAPSVRLLSRRMGEFFDEARFDPIALPGFSATHPATRLRRTHRTLAYLDAFDVLGERLAADDPFLPDDGAEIRSARTDAIDAIESLASSDAPLNRWLARRLVEDLDRPDEILADATERGVEADPSASVLQPIADAYAEYRWIDILAGTVPDATGTVADALT
ncbi:hypothetical protein [Halopenitus persicus]|uniref:Uncharacterized protein n=1 Tax=Halopenitus persicus TaxID=1048396 RepID=A0A1H3K1N4_9EURY|nr:hypothetical protein [Halopenitus persicus]SDY46092.1 hypothetical protein SAMN05216564_105224 [Halopenitus persicus]